MCVADRVMDRDVHALYDPSNNCAVSKVFNVVESPSDHNSVQDATCDGATNYATINHFGIANAPEYVKDFVAKAKRFKDLQDKYKHARLMTALMKEISSNQD